MNEKNYPDKMNSRRFCRPFGIKTQLSNYKISQALY